MQVCPPKFWILKALGLWASLLFSQGTLIAGVYYSKESYNELPSQWRGLLMDQRQLRQLALEPKQTASELRKKYLQDKSRLDKLSKERKLLPEEFADLGALLIRLNQAPIALKPCEKQTANIL